MPNDRYAKLYRRIETALKEKSKRMALYTAMKRGRDSRREALEALAQGDAFRQEVRAIKLRCLAKQDELIDRFAPRAREFSIYIMPGYANFGDILDRLGKHKIGKSCLYVRRLSDIDEDVLGELIRAGLKDLATYWDVHPA